MRIPLHNSPQRALGEEWFGQLDDWWEAHGTAGYDPFDVKAHPWLQRVQPYRWPRRVTTLLTDLFPYASRRLLHIPPTENPKTHALIALGALRVFQALGEDYWLDKARIHLNWLTDHAAEGHAGPCWGYPFPVTAQGLRVPAGTPVLVVSAIAGEAFGLAGAITGNPADTAMVEGVARFIRDDLPRLEGDGEGYCFAYSTDDRRRVHNANFLAVEHLARASCMTGDASYWTAAQPALSFSLAAQRPDGAWPYGAWRQGEPFEAGLMALIDHHHTGFVLRSLHTLSTLYPDAFSKKVLDQGYRFYRDRLITAEGMPRTEKAVYPVDIHACAEAALCFSVMADRYREAYDRAWMALRWAHWRLSDHQTHAPFYRKYRHFTTRITYPRWGVAWMYRALGEYIWQGSRREHTPVS